METKQFYFTGLAWMNFEDVERMNKSLSVLEEFGIKHKFEQDKCRLTISGYTDVLLNRERDDSVTFLRKIQGYYGSGTDEDSLLIFTINDDMEIKAKVLNYWGDGEIENINL